MGLVEVSCRFPPIRKAPDLCALLLSGIISFQAFWWTARESNSPTDVANVCRHLGTWPPKYFYLVYYLLLPQARGSEPFLRRFYTMAQFNVSFQVQGIGQVDLPVTPLDDLIVLVNGLEVKTFRFSVENITPADLTFNITSTQSGSAADKITVTFTDNPVTILAGQSSVVVSTITAIEPLLESDAIIDVAVVGTQA